MLIRLNKLQHEYTIYFPLIISTKKIIPQVIAMFPNFNTCSPRNFIMKLISSKHKSSYTIANLFNCDHIISLDKHVFHPFHEHFVFHNITLMQVSEIFCKMGVYFR